MKTLGRRAGMFAVAHKKNNRRHPRVSRFKVDVSVEIDFEFGRIKEVPGPKERLRRPSFKETSLNLDYRPPDYKPSWDPEGLCVMCLEKLGLKFMPVRPKNEETGLLEPWHYECFQAAVDAAEWIKGHEARTGAKDFLEEELEEEEVAV